MESNTARFFHETMEKNYQVKNLVGISPEDFRKQIDIFLSWRDGAMEGYRDNDKQRDLSIQFHWGHYHDFGEFKLDGRMGERHCAIPAFFHDHFNALPLDLSGKKVLDIGVWTGGTSLLLCALGAEVVAIEEVKKYVMALEFLKKSFNVSRLQVLNKSLFELNAPEFFDRFDYVLFSGVIYHVTDPIVALRIAFNSLKDGGKCLTETVGYVSESPLLYYTGPNTIGAGTKERMDRGGWNWFTPSPPALKMMMEDSGFTEVKTTDIVNQRRIMAVGTRSSHCDINRAGLSVRNIR